MGGGGEGFQLNVTMTLFGLETPPKGELAYNSPAILHVNGLQ